MNFRAINVAYRCERLRANSQTATLQEYVIDIKGVSSAVQMRAFGTIETKIASARFSKTICPIPVPPFVYVVKARQPPAWRRGG